MNKKYLSGYMIFQDNFRVDSSKMLTDPQHCPFAATFYLSHHVVDPGAAELRYRSMRCLPSSLAGSACLFLCYSWPTCRVLGSGASPVPSSLPLQCCLLTDLPFKPVS